MDILNTGEARWFIEDVESAEAAALRAWFAGAAPEPDREDRYLLTGRDDLGLKARAEEGRPTRIEAKYLLGSLGPAVLDERFVGNVERWNKVSVDVSDPALGQRGEWAVVKKSRRVRRHACEGRRVTEIGASTPANAGCLVEVTELEVQHGARSRRALTVGFEAFGPTERLLEVLLRVSEHALESVEGVRLGFDHANNYPKWLARIARELA